jgi:hypothetical protein
MTQIKIHLHIKLDEHNHIEKLLLTRLDRLGWGIIALHAKPAHWQEARHRFTERHRGCKHMNDKNKTSQKIKLDECNHIGKPLLDQCVGPD